MRTHLTYANVMATIAVFLALGGGAYAALKLPRNSVGTKQIRPGAVRSSDVKNGALRAGDFAPGQLPRGAPGLPGAPGPPGPPGSPDVAADVLGKLSGIDGGGSGLDADLLDGKDAGDFLGAGRILFGRAPATADQALLIEWPAMGLRVTTRDTGTPDQPYNLRVTNTTTDRMFYVATESGTDEVEPQNDNNVGGTEGLRAVISESGGPGRMVLLGCYPNLDTGDDGMMQCVAVLAGAGA